MIVVMLTQEYLRSILDYNPDTGVFTWLENANRSKAWNTRWAGKVAGTQSVNGYMAITIKQQRERVRMYSHRLAFLYMEGEIPEQVDHINGVRSNNRWENLRAVDNFINSRNQKLRNTNTSGYNGVYWCKRRNLWYVRIGLNGKNLHGGYFEKKIDAVEARNKLDVKLNYHSQHGIKKGA
ncbi:pathogenesis-related transcriptional factor and ERF protein [Alteromonas phage PB15]|nr:pathogenesis-related transcriptional factor and ERF protein [Alteromonas phage PB15]